MWDKFLIGAQFLLLFLLFMAASISRYFQFVSLPTFAGAQALGLGGILCSLLYLFWGAKELGRFARVHPQPMVGAPLRTTGPYRFSRHPMYSGLIFGSGFWTLYLHSSFALFCSVLLIVILTLKATREESYLKKLHGDAYREYMRKVGRFTPFF